MTGAGEVRLAHLHFIQRTAALGCIPNAAKAMLPSIEDSSWLTGAPTDTPHPFLLLSTLIFIPARQKHTRWKHLSRFMSTLFKFDTTLQNTMASSLLRLKRRQ